MAKIMLAGEPMGLLIANEEGQLDTVNSFSAAVAGAEFNVAVGLTRLGHLVGYLTILGNDPFGGRIRRAMEENNISTTLISESKDLHTGFMFKSKVQKGDPKVFYFRKNSAASSISAEDVDQLDFSDYDALHLTGILPAISQSACAATFQLLEKARKMGMLVFFDPNLRPQLWRGNAVMVSTINALAEKSDYFLPGIAEGEILMGSRDPEAIASYYLSRGVGTVIVKCGSSGAYAMDKTGGFFVPGYKKIEVVDTVGAGDGFASGVISAICDGLPLKEAILRGNAIGAIQVQHVGDNEGLPTTVQLESFMKTHVMGEE